MTTIYNDGDFNKIRTQKQRAFQVFLGVTAAYLAFCIGWLIYYVSLPYADPMQTLPKVCVYVASALYVIFVFPFMGIKYHRIRRYYKMIYYLSEGLKIILIIPTNTYVRPHTGICISAAGRPLHGLRPLADKASITTED